MSKNMMAPVLGGLLSLTAYEAQASTVMADLVNLNGNTWEYLYTVSNDTLLIPIEEFTIFFDVNLYQNLAITSTPIGWDPLVIQPDPFLPDDGFYDALALSSPGIAPGELLGDFGVQFDFLGTGTPVSQPFDIVNPDDFTVLDTGITEVSVIPVPAAVWLFASALLGLVGISISPSKKE